MTLEEAIQQANNGDVDAMLALSDYYTGDGTSAEGRENALPWNEKAAENGSLLGARHALLYHKIDAIASELIGSFQSSESSWVSVNKWAYMVAMHPDANDEVKEAACSDFYDSIYYIARSLYCQDRKCEALKPLKSANDSTRVQILIGCCLWTIGGQTRDNKLLGEAFQKLSLIESDADYRNSINEKDLCDKTLFAEGGLLLAFLYRLGIPGVRAQNIDAAQHVLLVAFQAINDEDIKNMIQKELEHYQKKAFGGYRYV